MIIKAESDITRQMTEHGAFDKAQQPGDNWIADQYEKYGLGITPSLMEIEPVATELLSNRSTAISGAELVLNRRVDGNPDKEPVVLPLISTQGFTGEQRFGLLLMQRQIEENLRRENQD